MKSQIVLVSLATVLFSCSSKNANEAKTEEAREINSIAGEEYVLNSASSIMEWRGVKPAGEHTGNVKITEGQAIVKNGELVGGSVVVDMNSIINDDLTGNMSERLVGHLKSEDFFNVAEYPHAVFEISSVDKNEIADESGSGFAITGNLTMKGESRSITFPAKIKVSDVGVSVSTDEFSIDRTLWGVNYKSKSVFAEFKDDFINDMINLKFEADFVD